MAKKRNSRAVSGNLLFGIEATPNESPAAPADNQTQRGFVSSLGRGERIAAMGVCLLLALGALGAGLGGRIISVVGSPASNQAGSRSAESARNGSMLARLNPFAAAPPVTATPLPLSKEYIYAGSRMLAVEDAGASALPPADLAVWRPSDGKWYVLNSLNQWTVQQWGSINAGAGSDIPVPGDYDGDGRTDFSVFRPNNDTWYIINSSDSATSGYPFGSTAAGDKPAPADYDGDGRTDAAVYRPPTGAQTIGSWYIINSSGVSSPAPQLGAGGDAPVPADYDGDGRADPAVWRNSNATFYVLRSSDGTIQITQFGQTGDAPAVGDYDGDGKADYVVRRGSDWISKNSRGFLQTVAWETAADQAVQNDYDGDGKVDIAVWRPSNGVWYIRNSRDLSTKQVQWGNSGDVPVPAFYRR